MRRRAVGRGKKMERKVLRKVGEKVWGEKSHFTHLSPVPRNGLAALAIHQGIAGRTGAAVAAIVVGAQLSTARLECTLVYVLALFVVGHVAGFVAVGAKAKGARGGSVM